MSKPAQSKGKEGEDPEEGSEESQSQKPSPLCIMIVNGQVVCGSDPEAVRHEANMLTTRD